ncbi:MAG: hypothetical protein ACRBEE_13640 [Arenicella sp.]
MNDRKKGINLVKMVNSIQYIGFISLLIVSGTYFFHFQKYGISSKPEHWGVFGDYLGGVLGAIFGFLTLLAVLYALYIQTDRLDKSIKISEKNLETTKEELKKSNDLQQSQYEVLRIQNFESSFFKLLEFLYNSRQKINYSGKGDKKPFEVFQDCYHYLEIGLRNSQTDKNVELYIDKYFSEMDLIAAHLRTFEVLISYVNKASFGEEIEKKYLKMITAGAFLSELVLLMHFSFIPKNENIKKALEKGALLESIPVDFGGDFFFIDESLYKSINKTAFGSKEPDMFDTENINIRTHW